MKTKIYIAGPMTGLPENNYPAFFEASRFLEKFDYQPLNPAACPACPDEIPGADERWAWYMRRGIELLIQAEEIAMLANWHTSKGASLEKRIAEALGMKVWSFTGTDLRELWI